jgi:hypothetical protein
MALRIFISSTRTDFEADRTALENTIRRLEAVFVGMEHFGSDPRLPADACAALVKSCDLFVCLVGQSYGSIDSATGRSFTEGEYETAESLMVPCLIYFAEPPAPGAAGNDQRLHLFKQTLRQRHIVATFSTPNQLVERFLLDLIKLLQGPLQSKVSPHGGAGIPADVFHAFTKSMIDEQIELVGQEKYVASLYVDRAVATQIDAFASSDATFHKQLTETLEWLLDVDRRWRLGASAAIQQMQQAVVDSDDSTVWIKALDLVRRPFHASAIDVALKELTSAIRATSDDDARRHADTVLRQLRAIPIFDAASVAKVGDLSRRARDRYLSTPHIPPETLFADLYLLFPSKGNYESNHLVSTTLASDVFKTVRNLIERHSKRCFAIVDKAGTGKTNMVCSAATRLIDTHPVFLLSGRMLLHGADDIERHVQRGLEQRFNGLFGDWLDRVTPGLRARSQWLVVIVDGINEGDNSVGMIDRLATLLARSRSRRIKLLISCRDISWEFFQRRLEPHLFDATPLAPQSFTDLEFEVAVQRYFAHFEVHCDLGPDARQALRHPLMLRVFCEAHRGAALGRVDDVRRLQVFDLYLTRIIENVVGREPRWRAAEVGDSIVQIGHAMWQAHKTSIPAQAMSNGGASPEHAAMYRQLLQENVLAEDGGWDRGVRRTRFTFDEIAEYVIARGWAREVDSDIDPAERRELLIADAIVALTTFNPTLGAVLFCDQMLGLDGRMVAQLLNGLARSPETMLALNQMKVLHAFDYLPAERFETSVLDSLVEFEGWAGDDVRRRLGGILLRALAYAPESPVMRRLLVRLLEVDSVASATVDSSGIAETVPAPEVSDSVRSADTTAAALPPATFHYDETTKLSAIAILLTLPDGEELGAAGMQQLGQLDLHQALQALAALNNAPDDVVYRAVEKQRHAALPEYRLYSAWLLRSRFGPRAAESLASLLADQDTRVHRYVARLLEKRGVETPLMELLLKRLAACDSRATWHLVNFVRALGRWLAMFDPDVDDVSSLSRVMTALERHLLHTQPSVRAETLVAMRRATSDDVAARVRSLTATETDTYVLSLLRAMTKDAGA